jgi:hypothetical protein
VCTDRPAPAHPVVLRARAEPAEAAASAPSGAGPGSTAPVTSPASAPPAAVRGRAALIVGIAAAVVAAIAAVVVNRWLFPLYSINRDDSVYVAMARVLERGHATLPLDDWFFRPWASGRAQGHIAFKYAPPWPAMLATGDTLTGSMLAGLAVTAALAVVAVRALAVEVLHDRRTASLASVLLVLCPLFLIQSATYLPYVFSLALGAGACALLLAGSRIGSRPRVVLGGALAGVAVVARPFDAVLLLVPVLVGLALSMWHDRRRLVRVAGASAAGAGPVLVAFAIYDWVVLGSPTKLPFNVTGSADAFGFGRRGIFDSSTVPFGFTDGLSGTGQCLRWLLSWVVGGPLLVALAAGGAWIVLRRGSGPARWVVASWIVVIPVAYTFFWGPWAMSHNWDGVQSMGPFYHLPLVVPLVVFGAAGLRALATRRRVLVSVLALAMVGFTAWSLPDKVDINDRTTAQYRAVEHAVDRSDLSHAVLFLPLRTEGGFLSISPFLEYDPSMNGDVLYAQDCGTVANRDLLAAHPGRRGYRLAVVDNRHPERTESYSVRPIDADPLDRHAGCAR